MCMCVVCVFTSSVNPSISVYSNLSIYLSIRRRMPISECWYVCMYVCMYARV